MFEQTVVNSRVVKIGDRFFRMIAAWWASCAVCSALCAAGRGVVTVLKGSAVARMVCRFAEMLSVAWKESFFCRRAEGAVNVPGTLLRMLQYKNPEAFENSLFARAAVWLGGNVPVLFGWFVAVVMNIPYAAWNNGYLLMCGVICFLLLSAGGMYGNLRLNITQIGPYFVFFFIAVCLSWPLSMYPDESGRFLLYHGACALNLLVMVSAVEKREELERVAGFGCLGMLGASLLAFAQRIRGVEVNELLVDVSLNPDMPGRVYSVYDNPNAFAVVLVLLIPVAAAMLLGAKDRRWKGVGLISALCGGVALIMSYSRASWVGLLAAGFLFLLLWNRRLIPGLVVVGAALVPFLPSAILTRILTIFNSNDTSIASRVPLLEAGVSMIKTRPFTGAGLGTDAARHAIYKLELYKGTSAYVHSHNTYVEIWMETGLLGISSFVAGMIRAFVCGGKVLHAKRGKESVRLLIIGTLSGLCGALVCGLVDYIWNYPRVMFLFWFVVGLLMCAVKLADREAE